MQELVQAIYAADEDEGPWLVYADWLEEQGDERAEYLRWWVELRRVMAGLWRVALRQLEHPNAREQAEAEDYVRVRINTTRGASAFARWNDRRNLLLARYLPGRIVKQQAGVLWPEISAHCRQRLIDMELQTCYLNDAPPHFYKRIASRTFSDGIAEEVIDGEFPITPVFLFSSINGNTRTFTRRWCELLLDVMTHLRNPQPRLDAEIVGLLPDLQHLQPLPRRIAEELSFVNVATSNPATASGGSNTAVGNTNITVGGENVADGTCSIATAELTEQVQAVLAASTAKTFIQGAPLPPWWNIPASDSIH